VLVEPERETVEVLAEVVVIRYFLLLHLLVVVEGVAIPTMAVMEVQVVAHLLPHLLREPE
jgi:hypothetical protein